MAEFGANLELIPIALIADDVSELYRLCYLNNVINQMKFIYALPVKELSNGKREIWFYGDIKIWKDPTTLSKDESDLALGAFGEVSREDSLV